MKVSANVLGLTGINLPIGLQVASAQAHAKSANCTVPRKNSTATISVQPQPVSLCIANGADTAINGAMSCTTPAQLVTIPVLGIAPVNILANVSPAANSGWTDETIAISQIGLNPQTDVNGNSPPRVGTTGLFSSILNSSTTIQLTLLGLPLGALGQSLVLPALALIGSTLDTVLTPLLGLLGIQLGYADIKLLSLDCDAVELVY